MGDSQNLLPLLGFIPRLDFRNTLFLKWFLPCWYTSSLKTHWTTSAPLRGAFHWLPCTLSRALRSPRACSFSQEIITNPRPHTDTANFPRIMDFFFASDLQKIQIQMELRYLFHSFSAQSALGATSVGFSLGVAFPGYLSEPCLWAHSVFLADQPDDTGKVSSRRKNPSRHSFQWHLGNQLPHFCWVDYMIEPFHSRNQGMSAALWAQEDTGGDDQDDVRDAQNPGAVGMMS